MIAAGVAVIIFTASASGIPASRTATRKSLSAVAMLPAKALLSSLR